MSIAVGFSQKLGVRGMVATEEIKAGDVVEICPLLIVPEQDIPKLKETFLRKYLFSVEEATALCLGYGSLYNHVEDNNIDVVTRGKRVFMTANRDIEAGEELFISYGDNEEEVVRFYEFEKKM